ncbi:TonB-dependent receptor [Sphingobacterium sp. Ka21]|uniref:TonB-dependent receptor n=2 Tax=Sphingobacterium pedocola TaxID=2082722 RepID=A0ABR9TA80_9SPHI|nr:TonB-dependent receptor [Sphingobacterium pedocola]
MRILVENKGLQWSLEEGIVTIFADQKESRNHPGPRHAIAEDLQEKVIFGKVSDESRRPVAGATIQLKGTDRQTKTDDEGNYRILIPANFSGTAVLVFSSIGFETIETNVNNKGSTDVSLKPAIGDMDEVVVVGMNFRQTKRSVTGAMATIETKALKQSPVANLNNALAGRLPGLITVQSSGQPGQDAAAMYIRGVGTYGPNRAPLVVIDGLPRGQGNFSQIDPNEVESISILKDASSSALYGIQGANGVIVVTTKRGSSSQKPNIDFTTQQAIQSPYRLPQNMSGYDIAKYWNEWDINSDLLPRFSEQALEIVRTGADPYLYPDVNWFDEILKSSSPQSHYNLNISGSSNRVRYFASGSYINQGTLLKHDDEFFDNYGVKSKFDRYNFRSNLDIEATSLLSIQIDLAGRLENRVGPGSGFESIFSHLTNMSPVALPVFNPDGSLGAASNVEIPYYQNPYGSVTRGGYYTNTTNVMYGTLSAKHDLGFLANGLDAQMFFSFENNNYKGTSRLQQFDMFWYRGADQQGAPIYQQTDVGTRLTTSGTSAIERSNYLDFRLNYRKNWNEHNFSAQVLANRTLRVLNDELPYAYQGISGRLTYNFKNRYFVETNMGFNGSENFPPTRRYGFFPSVSAGWIVSDEPFMEVSGINYLKVRGSYGVAGNDQVGGNRWLYISDYAPGGGFSFGESPSGRPGYNENRVGNRFVTWERSQKSNVGFEVSILPKDALQLTFDVFREYRANILTAPGSVPDYVGIGNLAPRNTGVVLNRGFEGELRFNKSWNDVRIFSNLMFTYARNKVLQNDQPTPMYGYQNLVGYEVGYTIWYKALGFFNSEDEILNSAIQNFDSKTIPGDVKYMDVNSDGVINAYDRVPMQVQNIPRYMGGLSIGATYKGFDISLLLNGAMGGTADMVPSSRDIAQLQRWTSESAENARLPAPRRSENNALYSSLLLHNTDYIKLRNMELGYEIPPQWLKSVKLSAVRVFVNGQNLAVWDKLWIKDRDPEATSSWDVPYPIQRIVNFGVNIKL